MPDPEETRPAAGARESRVTFHQHFRERTRLAFGRSCARLQVGAVFKSPAGSIDHAPAQAAFFMVVMVANRAVAIRQSKGDWSQTDAEPIREPFGHKINASLAPATNIGAHVQEVVSGDWLEQELQRCPAPSGPHAPERKCHQRYESTPFDEIKVERNR